MCGKDWSAQLMNSKRRTTRSWSLQGARWKGRLRKKVGSYRIIFIKFPSRTVVEISSILIKSKDIYK
jgi:hypothetical protein